MILFCSLCKHEETTFPHAFVFIFYFIRVILSKKCHKWGVGERDIKGKMVIQGGEGVFLQNGGFKPCSNQVLHKEKFISRWQFYSPQNFVFLEHIETFFFVIFENFYMSPFGCFQFQASTCFLEEIPPRYGSGQ